MEEIGVSSIAQPCCSHCEVRSQVKETSLHVLRTARTIRLFWFVMMMMMICFCGMVDRRKACSLISSWGHCQRFSPSRISDTPPAGFEPALNLSLGLVE